MNNQKTLITGATGKTGSRIFSRLQALGHDVRPGSRNMSIPFDWNDPSTWKAALDGIDAVYMVYYPDLAVPGAPETIQAFTDFAVAAGVQKLVLLSGRGEQHAEHCERIVFAGGVDATVIRASWFNQNFDEGLFLEAVHAGTLAIPAGEIQEPFLDLEDLAEVAVTALTEDGHAGKIYEVTGPELLTFAEVAAKLSEAAGHKVEYLPISFEEHHAIMTAAEGKEFADFLTELCKEVLDGRNAFLGHGVQEALGRAPKSFTDYCTRIAATGVWNRDLVS
ncbi:MAG: NmrA family transcriptional regulator [Planctomycetota bacterium]